METVITIFAPILPILSEPKGAKLILGFFGSAPVMKRISQTVNTVGESVGLVSWAILNWAFPISLLIACSPPFELSGSPTVTST